MQKDFFQQMASELKARNNPTDLKASVVGVVTTIEPVSVSTDDGAIILTEGVNLNLSEWFRFRCDIDKTKALSKGVLSDLKNAQNVSETHSQSGTPCNMPSAIALLASAILKVSTELLQLKCNLKVGDFVVLSSLEQNGKYVLIDKVLDVS